MQAAFSSPDGSISTVAPSQQISQQIGASRLDLPDHEGPRYTYSFAKNHYDGERRFRRIDAAAGSCVFLRSIPAWTRCGHAAAGYRRAASDDREVDESTGL